MPEIFEPRETDEFYIFTDGGIATVENYHPFIRDGVAYELYPKFPIDSSSRIGRAWREAAGFRTDRNYRQVSWLTYKYITEVLFTPRDIEYHSFSEVRIRVFEDPGVIAVQNGQEPPPRRPFPPPPPPPPPPPKTNHRIGVPKGKLP